MLFPLPVPRAAPHSRMLGYIEDYKRVVTGTNFYQAAILDAQTGAVGEVLEFPRQRGVMRAVSAGANNLYDYVVIGAATETTVDVLLFRKKRRSSRGHPLTVCVLVYALCYVVAAVVWGKCGLAGKWEKLIRGTRGR
ncbi:hypothetical protein AAF712_007983 [Marasmius tenuissimus]|uniref:CN hydrolase domain-containing protein n=1 Tax=Marasmius tenuissimus TaxID=585030 RepID=A0ABR2ZXI5_9AGAR